MEKTKIELNQLDLIGISTVTTTNCEMNPGTSKVAPLFTRYMSEQLATRIKQKTNPGVTYLVYASLKSDGKGENNWFAGEYKCFIGEQVQSLDNQDVSVLEPLTIAKSAYQKFTTAPGKIPDISINAWQKIWAMQEHEFDGKPTHIADFEIYDQRKLSSNNATIDIYIGIE